MTTVCVDKEKFVAEKSSSRATGLFCQSGPEQPVLCGSGRSSVLDTETGMGQYAPEPALQWAGHQGGPLFPSSKTGHSCGWKWEEMNLSDRVFLCQNPKCAYYQFTRDRDSNAALNILREALRLIGLIDQVVGGTGSDEDVKLAVDPM